MCITGWCTDINIKYDEIKIILIRIVYIIGFLASSFVLLLVWGLITAVTMPGVTPPTPPLGYQIALWACASVYPTGKRTSAERCVGFFNRLRYLRIFAIFRMFFVLIDWTFLFVLFAATVLDKQNLVRGICSRVLFLTTKGHEVFLFLAKGAEGFYAETRLMRSSDSSVKAKSCIVPSFWWGRFIVFSEKIALEIPFFLQNWRDISNIIVTIVEFDLPMSLLIEQFNFFSSHFFTSHKTQHKMEYHLVTIQPDILKCSNCRAPLKIPQKFP